MTTCCNGRQCFRCDSSNISNFCRTCKKTFCRQCKEMHVICLDTRLHDLVVYLEKYEHFIQETCDKHPDKMYKSWCQDCEQPFCISCTEHQYHKVTDIELAYAKHREATGEKIALIRGDFLPYSYAILSSIQSDILRKNSKAFIEDVKRLSYNMELTIIRIKNIINEVQSQRLENFKKVYNLNAKLQIRKMKKRICATQRCVNSFEESANKPVEFLILCKKIISSDHKNSSEICILSGKDNSFSSETNKEGVISLMKEIRRKKLGHRRRQLGYKQLFKLESKAYLQKSLALNGIEKSFHISFSGTDQYWINDGSNLMLFGTNGNDPLYHLTEISHDWGVHTVTNNCELIFIDKNFTINKLSADHSKKSMLLQVEGPWTPVCLYSSPSTGDLLIGVRVVADGHTSLAKLLRYSSSGSPLNNIECYRYYKYPAYITENNNGDVIVSDRKSESIVVTDSEGKYRFSYGDPLRTKFSPRGVCTDVLSNILVCNNITNVIHVIDKDGKLLSRIRPRPYGLPIKGLYGLSYDSKEHLLYIGCIGNVSGYRYLQRQICYKLDTH